MKLKFIRVWVLQLFAVAGSDAASATSARLMAESAHLAAMCTTWRGWGPACMLRTQAPGLVLEADDDEVCEKSYCRYRRCRQLYQLPWRL